MQPTKLPTFNEAIVQMYDALENAKTPEEKWKCYGMVIRCQDVPTELYTSLEGNAQEYKRRLKANIDADLQGLPLPYPPAKPTCPHCGHELD